MTRSLGALFFAFLLNSLGLTPAAAHVATESLNSTGKMSGAGGDCTTMAHPGGRGDRLLVRVGGLTPNTTFQLLSNGVHVADLTTNGGGRARLRFRTGRHGRHDLDLNFDPTAGPLVIATPDGTPVLTTEAHDAEPSPSNSQDPSPSNSQDPSPSNSQDPSPSASPSVSNSVEPSPSASVSPSHPEPSQEPSDHSRGGRG